MFILCWAISRSCCWRRRTSSVSRSGRATQAIRDHDLAAEVLGVRRLPSMMNAFIISSVLGGLAEGSSVSCCSTSAQRTFGLELSIQYVVIIVIGGLASISGRCRAAVHRARSGSGHLARRVSPVHLEAGGQGGMSVSGIGLERLRDTHHRLPALPSGGSSRSSTSRGAGRRDTHRILDRHDRHPILDPHAPHPVLERHGVLDRRDLSIRTRTRRNDTQKEGAQLMRTRTLGVLEHGRRSSAAHIVRGADRTERRRIIVRRRGTEVGARLRHQRRHHPCRQMRRSAARSPPRRTTGCRSAGLLGHCQRRGRHRGEYPVEVITADNQYKPQLAVQEYERVKDQVVMLGCAGRCVDEALLPHSSSRTRQSRCRRRRARGSRRMRTWA